MQRPPSWKRQAAIFAAIASAFTGLGILIIVFFTSRHDTAEAKPSPIPAARSDR